MGPAKKVPQATKGGAAGKNDAKAAADPSKKVKTAGDDADKAAKTAAKAALDNAEAEAEAHLKATGVASASSGKNGLPAEEDEDDAPPTADSAVATGETAIVPVGESPSRKRKRETLEAEPRECSACGLEFNSKNGAYRCNDCVSTAMAVSRNLPVLVHYFITSYIFTRAQRAHCQINTDGKVRYMCCV